MCFKNKVLALAWFVILWAIVGSTLLKVSVGTVPLIPFCLFTIAMVGVSMRITNWPHACNSTAHDTLLTVSRHAGRNVETALPVLPTIDTLWADAETWRREQAIAFRWMVIAQTLRQYGKPAYEVIVEVPEQFRQCIDRLEEIVAWLTEDGWNCHHGWKPISRNEEPRYELHLSKLSESQVREPLPPATSPLAGPVDSDIQGRGHIKPII